MLLAERLELVIERVPRLHPVGKLELQRLAIHDQCLHGIDTDGRMQVTLEGIEQERRALVGIEADHPGLQIDVADREARVIEQGGIVAREATRTARGRHGLG